MKKWLALALALTIPLVLSGCLVIDSLSVSQLNTVGNVRIALDVCFSQTAGSCTDKGNSAEISGGTTQQPLIAFRVPSAALAPSTFATTAGESLTFNESTEFEQKLQALDPAPTGQYWVAYMATTSVVVTDGANQTFTVAPEFTLGQSADGSPFTGPFLYRPTVGSREVTSSLLIGRALDCGTSLFAPNSTSVADTICIDSPSQADTATNLSLSTRDLGIVASNATGKAGDHKSISFLVKYAGASTAVANFALDATTSVPGGTATPSQGSLLPATDSSNPVTVVVTVPKQTPVGSYNVTLNARLANGQVRTSTATLTITDKIKPTATITLVKGQKISTLLAGALKLKVKMSEAGTVAIALTTKSSKPSKAVTIAQGTVSFSKASTKVVKLKLKKSAAARSAQASLRYASVATLVVRSTARDLAGNTRKGTKRITLKR